ncbi:MAG: hypothetical protein GY716_24795 [bacterium]|nr:hypothetical protein [bacterium]
MSLDPSVERALVRGRLIVGLPPVVVLLLTTASVWLAGGVRASFLVMPAMLLGLVSPVLGYRTYLYLRDRPAAETDPAARVRVFEQANLAASGLATSIAALGWIAFTLSGRPEALAGVATQVIVAGAVWPTPERLEGFLE